jgi:hypothetical protein
MRSVKMSVSAGGDMKSLVLMVHLPPPWQSGILLFETARGQRTRCLAAPRP